ncbi:MAG TPA: hypothetical protein VHR66_06830 [Gemmataceae bacterium]|jgi:WD40 repeat protein|nr:hypothetical protein [Gemmataceae bacterium]
MLQHRLVVIAFVIFITSNVFAEPSALDAIVPAKLPALLRPPKGTPSEVVAVLALQRGDRIDCLAVRADGKALALGGPDQIVRLWDLEKMRVTSTLKLPQPVVSLAFAADGKTLAVGDAGGSVRLLKAEGGALSAKVVFLAHKDAPIWAVSFSPDGTRLYSAARDKSAAVWDIAKPKPARLALLEGHEIEVRSLSLDADGKVLTTAGNQDKTIRLWDVSTDAAKTAGQLKLADRVVSVAVSPDGTLVAVGGAKGVPAIFERKGTKLTKKADLDTGGRAATGVSFNADGDRIVGMAAHSGIEDRVVVWNTKGEVIHEFRYERHLHAVAFAPDGRHLIVITESDPMIVRLPK